MSLELKDFLKSNFILIEREKFEKNKFKDILKYFFDLKICDHNKDLLILEKKKRFFNFLFRGWQI